jgi:alpha-ketoglutarate-dependent taurine dioxygenase
VAESVRALAPIGVEVRGIDLGPRLDDATFGRLRGLLLAHGIVVVREQKLEPAEQVALGRRFGPIEGQEYSLGSANPDVIMLSNVDGDGRVVPRDHTMMKTIAINEQWHTDSSFREVPASVSIFAAVVVPPEGGDTFYASMRRGWLELPEERRTALRGLRAVHDYGQAYRNTGGAGLPAAISNGLPPIVHPLVRLHPETGEESLYVSGHVYGVEGRDPAAGRGLVQDLVAWCTRPERVYRHRWQLGDVLLWDNRCMLHRAQGFDEAHARVMRHVRVAGSGPVVAAGDASVR